MLKSIRFMKEPGFTYDLFFIFTLYFNKQYCETKYTNQRKTAEDVRFFEKVLEEFKPISEDLLLFFHLDDAGQSFMTKYYFDTYVAELLNGTYNLSVVHEALLDYDRVIDNLLEFYFGDKPEETRIQCKNSISVANTLIRASGYDARIKAALYDFLIDPYTVLRRVSHELMTKEFLLTKQYERNTDKLNALQNGLDIEAIADRLRNSVQQSVDIDCFNKVVVALCLNHKNLLLTFYYDDVVLLMFGSDYIDMLQSLAESKSTPALHEFGLAVSEENRVAILEMIREKHEVTIKEVEQELALAGTNAYYHLSLLLRTGLLKTRNRGRTVLYSLNQTYFDLLLHALAEYSENSEKAK